MKLRKKRYINQRKRKRHYPPILVNFTETYSAQYRDVIKVWLSFISKEQT